MKVNLEEGRVSIIRQGTVSVAFPVGLSKLELGCVLQGLAGLLIADELEKNTNGNGNGNGNGHNRIAAEVAEPVVQTPQGKNRLTKFDRRGLPRKKVVKRSRDKKTETLSCGHKISVPSNWKTHGARACEQCAVVATS